MAVKSHRLGCDRQVESKGNQKKEVPLKVKRTANGHAKQTLTLFKEGVPERGREFLQCRVGRLKANVVK